MTNEDRIEALYVKKLQSDVALFDAVTDCFKDKTRGAPIAYLLAQAAKEAAEATVALTEVSATNVVEITRLQQVVIRQKDIVRWISTALIAGQQAYELLSIRERAEVAGEILDSLPEGD